MTISPDVATSHIWLQISGIARTDGLPVRLAYQADWVPRLIR
jgi:hypothetical protein